MKKTIKGYAVVARKNMTSVLVAHDFKFTVKEYLLLIGVSEKQSSITAKDFKVIPCTITYSIPKKK